MRQAARLAIAAALSAPFAAFATEGGGSMKPPGQDTILSGVMTPPGWLFTSTTTAYNADRLLDSSGHDRAGFANVDVSARAIAVRATYVWPGAHVLGADVETRIGTAFVDVRLKADVQTPAGAWVKGEFSASGNADTLAAPILLGWHAESFHQIAGVALFIPTGKFVASNPASVGRGYYAAAPTYSFTWFPRSLLEVSGSAFYIVNGENPDTNYRSGRELAFDYNVGYGLRPGWQAGLVGFLYQQVSDDQQNGSTFRDGFRGRAIGIGPFIRMYGRNWGMSLRWQHETGVENRSKGDRFYLGMGIKI